MRQIVTGAADVKIWETGKSHREFLSVGDFADACVFVVNLEKDAYDTAVQPKLPHINLGTGLCDEIERAYERSATYSIT